jgi:hypothetical protein
VAADQAQPQMNPRVTRFQAFLASIPAWMYWLNFLNVFAGFRCHCVILLFPCFPKFWNLFRAVDSLHQKVGPAFSAAQML